MNHSSKPNKRIHHSKLVNKFAGNDITITVRSKQRQAQVHSHDVESRNVTVTLTNILSSISGDISAFLDITDTRKNRKLGK